MKVPFSSAAPARSASPSSSSARSWPPSTVRRSASSMFGRIGSGLRPPKYGLRSWWISRTWMRPPLQQPADPAGPGAVQRIDEDRHVGRPERIEIDRPPHELLVAVVRVEALDEPGTLRVGEGPAVDGLLAVDRQSCLDDAQDLGSGRSPGRGLDLEPVVDPGVVAGGDDDARGRAPRDHLVRAHLGRDRVGGEGDRDVVGQEDLGGRLRRSAPTRTAGRTPRPHPWPRRPAPRRSGRRRRRSGGRCRT